MFSRGAQGKSADDGASLIPSSTEMQPTHGLKNYETIGQDQSNHCHNPADAEVKVDSQARRKILIASVLCLVFMAGEIVGGTLASSLAIMTDAAHLLTDFASFMINLLALYLAARPATRSMSFGWHRAEVIGALISVLLIWIVTSVLFYLAVERVIHMNFAVDGKIMLITSSIGVVVNLIMAVILHQHGHSHGASRHSRDSSAETPSPMSTPPPEEEAVNDAEAAEAAAPAKGADDKHDKHGKESGGHSHNMNVRAAFIHVIGDLIQSIGILVAAIIIFVQPSYKLADPICTFIFSILVLCTTITILRDAMNILMEGAPHGIDFGQVVEAMRDIEGVKDVHNLHMWSLTTSRTALSAHLAIDKSHAAAAGQSQRILHEARRRMRHQFKLSEVTIQLEEYDEEMAQCHLCKHPKN